ncbi:dUTP nucleotidohydrolase [Bacillus phage TsarBomba]|uniref:dUTP diphosphatase n=1 Tax=Bacillus phage TsarBomba TaxID=1690456 RepID=A0A0K2D093_9CAUD|nr:dUTP nucleotidohydrolase [Bacillus phage TsarBomba]ALA13006.1 dUTP nucleotidohydrolase [Bacillus phage TsarBomba]
MKKVDVLYNTEEGLKPTQAYPGDFAYDIYASEGRLVPPMTFSSVIVPTDFKLAFDPDEYGLKMNLRSGVSVDTPLILSNGTGIVEGTYRNGLGIILRNVFTDNRLVPFAFDTAGNRVEVSSIPKQVLRKARKDYEEESEKLGYESLTPYLKEHVFVDLVPAGTVYIAKHIRVAQIHFQEKVEAEFTKSAKLPDSVRGTKGTGSSGTKKKG